MSDKRLPDEPLFENYVCSIEMFLDLIKRKVVCEVEKAPKGNKPFFHENSWSEIVKTRDEGRDIVFNFSDADEHDRKYRLPDPFFEYELTIDQIVKGTVTFDFAFSDNKYPLSGLKVDQWAFYVYADKLKAHVRFRTEWASIDEPLGHLIGSLSRKTLRPVHTELKQALSQLRDPHLKTYDPVCAELLRLTEKLLRNIRQQKQWSFKGDTLDSLVTGVSQAAPLSEDTTQMLRLVSKPYRDYILHGHSLTPTVAKTVLATTMEAISRLSAELE